MKNDTIKAAEEYANKSPNYESYYSGFLAGAEYMQAQKDEQIKELVEALEKNNVVLKAFNFRHTRIIDNDKLIQKYKR